MDAARPQSKVWREENGKEKNKRERGGKLEGDRDTER